MTIKIKYSLDGRRRAIRINRRPAWLSPMKRFAGDALTRQARKQGREGAVGPSYGGIEIKIPPEEQIRGFEALPFGDRA